MALITKPRIQRYGEFSGHRWGLLIPRRLYLADDPILAAWGPGKRVGNQLVVGCVCDADVVPSVATRFQLRPRKAQMPTIDHVLGVDVSPDDGNNELVTLDCLRSGITTLTNSVLVMEQPIREEEARRGRRSTFFGFGLLPPEQEALVPCLFHWFGTSVCNYARLVGFLSGIAQGKYSRSVIDDPKNYDLIKKQCDEYVDSIPELAPIKLWRNKVFAHFAITDPRKADSAALLDASVMSPISYFDGRLRVGGMVFYSHGGESEMPPWSVTESFELLAPRFWPIVHQPEAVENAAPAGT